MIRTKGARYIAESLKDNKSLNILNLSIHILYHIDNANIRTEGGRCLLESLKKNKSLGMLDLCKRFY